MKKFYFCVVLAGVTLAGFSCSKSPIVSNERAPFEAGKPPSTVQAKSIESRISSECAKLGNQANWVSGLDSLPMLRVKQSHADLSGFDEMAKYQSERVAILKDLTFRDKFANQLYDFYQSADPPDQLTIEDPVDIVYHMPQNFPVDIYVYGDELIVPTPGGEYYSMEKYSWDFKPLGVFCENAYSIGGGNDTNPGCKVPDGAMKMEQFLQLLKNTCSDNTSSAGQKLNQGISGKFVLLAQSMDWARAQCDTAPGATAEWSKGCKKEIEATAKEVEVDQPIGGEFITIRDLAYKGVKAVLSGKDGVFSAALPPGQYLVCDQNRCNAAVIVESSKYTTFDVKRARPER